MDGKISQDHKKEDERSNRREVLRGDGEKCMVRLFNHSRIAYGGADPGYLFSIQHPLRNRTRAVKILPLPKGEVGRGLYVILYTLYSILYTIYYLRFFPAYIHLPGFCSFSRPNNSFLLEHINETCRSRISYAESSLKQ